MKHNKICSSPHKAHIFHHSITYTVKSAPPPGPAHAQQKVKTLLFVMKSACLNKRPSVLSRRRTWTDLTLIVRSSDELRAGAVAESLCSMQSFVICKGLTLNSQLGGHQRQLHHCETF